VQVVIGEPAHRVGRRVGAAEEDRAGAPQIGDDGIVLGGDEIAIGDDAIVGRAAALVAIDLGRHRHAVQRSARLATAEGTVGRVGRLPRLVGERQHDGVDCRIHCVEPVEAGVERFAAGKPPQADQTRQLDGVELPGFLHAYAHSVSVRPSQDRKRTVLCCVMKQENYVA
jgi:hypothetical protein